MWRPVTLILSNIVGYSNSSDFDDIVQFQTMNGYRSAIACSLLTQAGRTNVSDMVGGIKAWIATKLPTVPEGTMTCGTKVCETVSA